MNIKKNQIDSESKSTKSQRIMISVNTRTNEILNDISQKYHVTKSSVIAILVAKYAKKEFEIESEENA